MSSFKKLNFLKNLDLFEMPIQIKHKNGGLKSKCGGALSIMLVLSMLFIVSDKLRILINR